MEKVKKNILILPGAHNSPSARFRLINLINPLIDAGYNVQVRIPYPDRVNMGKKNRVIWWTIQFPKLASIIRYLTTLYILRDAQKFDYVVTNRDLVPEFSIKNIESNLIKRGVKLIFDFDDAIHIGDRKKKLDLFFSKLYAVTPGNEYLAKYANNLNSNVVIIPTVVDTKYYKPAKQRKPGKIRIGWSGSASTNIHCLPILQIPIEKLAQSSDFEFIVISNENPHISWAGVDIKFIKWEAETEVRNLQLFDIGLMPLNNNEFEKGKCGLKAIQYMGIGIPALVSPVGVNSKIIDNGVNGFHCISNEDWINNLMKLISDENLRKEMGKNAMAKVFKEYSVHKAIELWTKLLV
jgi:glycosyltransferase involved in cell wall biosynthesis